MPTIYEYKKIKVDSGYAEPIKTTEEELKAGDFVMLHRYDVRGYLDDIWNGYL